MSQQPDSLTVKKLQKELLLKQLNKLKDSDLGGSSFAFLDHQLLNLLVMYWMNTETNESHSSVHDRSTSDELIDKVARLMNESKEEWESVFTLFSPKEPDDDKEVKE